MYEHLKNELLMKLSGKLDPCSLESVSRALDEVACKYTVAQAELSLTVLGREEMQSIIKTYIVVKTMEGLSKETLKIYLLHLTLFMNAMRKPLNEIAANDIRLYLIHYQQVRGISNRSLDKVRTYLSSFFRWAASEEYIDKNPMGNFKPIKSEILPRCFLTQFELEMLRRACSTLRETAIIETFYSTGCRVSELTDIKLSDIDWFTHTVHLIGKGRKHRNSYLNAKAEVAINEYLSQRKHASEYLFCNDRGGGKMTRYNIERMFREIAARSGIEGKHITPHSLRHTTATQAIRSGMPVEDIQKLLGHSSIATTMVYAEASEDNVLREHKKYIV